MQPIILYDIPSKLPGNYWTPNPAKSRFSLNFKGLPFETKWIEYPDIAGVLQAIGAKPSLMSDGSQVYTVPVIQDPNTGAVITDSFAIAEYLDRTYPEKPLFPHGTSTLIHVFDRAFLAAGRDSKLLVLVRMAEILNPVSEEYFKRTREEGYGMKWEDFSPEGPKRDADWESLKAAHNAMNGWYEKGGKWIMGEAFSYADIIVACEILWYKRVFHEDEWVNYSTWNEGRWPKLLAAVQEECTLDLVNSAYLNTRPAYHRDGELNVRMLQDATRLIDIDLPQSDTASLLTMVTDKSQLPPDLLGLQVNGVTDRISQRPSKRDDIDDRFNKRE
ncbi:hypothetical protein BV22DRAFT_1051189 [Leucogyrophana mollusca]|uniref:Uncharacterized protein n=1 Tax=Leucogyrophana mollusca TaxID=85980 RepID=A0ACB8B2Z7_9AGAM|nr:hypothetical protein BV22DRAFT_1051189 [Leucogyrophana mollusca]